MSGISTFQRKTFEVQAIQVTAQNMRDLAEWSGGELYTPTASGRRRYIIVPSKGKNTSRAYVGDWITRMPWKEGYSHHVYNQQQFAEAFKPIPTEEQMHEKLLSLIVEAMDGNDWAVGPKGDPFTAESIAKNILNQL